MAADGKEEGLDVLKFFIGVMTLLTLFIAGYAGFTWSQVSILAEQVGQSTQVVAFEGTHVALQERGIAAEVLAQRLSAEAGKSAVLGARFSAAGIRFCHAGTGRAFLCVARTPLHS